MTLNLVRTGPRDTAPVVLLHSAGLDLTYWDAQISALHPNHDIVAVDLPGHGRSPGTVDTTNRGDVTSAVLQAIASLDASPVHLVGLSVGGLIAQSVALSAPATVTSLTLIDTAARFAEPGRRSMRARAAAAREHGMAAILGGLFEHWFLPDTRRLRPDLVDRATKTLLHDDAAVHAALWEMIADFDVHDRLDQINVPTMVLVGRHDSSSPVSSAEELADRIPRARLHVIEDAAHLSPIERPREVSQLMESFLAEGAAR